MRLTVDTRLFAVADSIAEEHVRRRWFETHVSALVRKIKLRTAIYAELARASGINPAVLAEEI